MIPLLRGRGGGGAVCTKFRQNVTEEESRQLVITILGESPLGNCFRL